MMNLRNYILNMKSIHDNISQYKDLGIVLEEVEENYEPVEDEVLEYATYLGINLKEDPELIWIAKEGLRTSVPEPWKPCRTPKGTIYYFNFETGESSWEHPFDKEYRKLYKSEKKLKIKREKVFDLNVENESKVV